MDAERVTSHVRDLRGEIETTIALAEQLTEELRTAMDDLAITSEIALRSIDLHNRVDHLWRHSQG